MYNGKESVRVYDKNAGKFLKAKVMELLDCYKVRIVDDGYDNTIMYLDESQVCYESPKLEIGRINTYYLPEDDFETLFCDDDIEDVPQYIYRFVIRCHNVIAINLVKEKLSDLIYHEFGIDIDFFRCSDKTTVDYFYMWNIRFDTDIRRIKQIFSKVLMEVNVHMRAQKTYRNRLHERLVVKANGIPTCAVSSCEGECLNCEHFRKILNSLLHYETIGLDAKTIKERLGEE